MFFGLFKSRRQKLKEEGENILDNFVPALKGMSADEIGGTLDLAAHMKWASTLYGSKTEELMLFEDPIFIPEEIAFDVLAEWRTHLISLSVNLEGKAKAGAFTIWYLSLLTTHIVELRFRGREMWGELQRGFQYCVEFDQYKDCVKGLEPFSD